MPVIFFDFDSTLITKETLELLAEEAMSDRGDENEKEKVLQEIEDLTNQGMNGEISLEESLQKRFALINLHKKHVDTVSENICDHLTESVKSNLDFFKNNSNNIYIVSGGFRECVLPICKVLGLSEENIFANEFICDEQGNILGVDMNLPTANKGGKLEIIKKLKKEKSKDKGLDKNFKTIMVGDGASDMEAKKKGGADIFIAYIETIKREKIVCNADFVSKNMIELIDILKKI